VLGDSVV